MSASVKDLGHRQHVGAAFVVRGRKRPDDRAGLQIDHRASAEAADHLGAHFVLTGASRARLGDRISDLQAMVAHHPLVAALSREVQLGAAVLEDIEEQGLSGSVWVPLTGGEPRPWTDL